MYVYKKKPAVAKVNTAVNGCTSVHGWENFAEKLPCYSRNLPLKTCCNCSNCLTYLVLRAPKAHDTKIPQEYFQDTLHSQNTTLSSFTKPNRFYLYYGEHQSLLLIDITFHCLTEMSFTYQDVYFFRWNPPQNGSHSFGSFEATEEEAGTFFPAKIKVIWVRKVSSGL